MSYRSDDDKINQEAWTAKSSGNFLNRTVGAPLGMDAPNNRAAAAVADFFAGQGGGISQLVAKPLSMVGGTFHKRLQNNANEMDTANFLYDKVLPVLQQNGMKITVQQVKDVLARTPLTDGGDTIKVDKLQIFKQAYAQPDQVLDHKQLFELLRTVSGELQEIVASGSSQLKVDWMKHLSSLTVEQKIDLLNWLSANGHPIPPGV